MGLVVLSLFDGIACGQQALKECGISVDKYYASEIDKHAINLTQHNWPDTVQVGDVQKLSYSRGVLHTEHGSHTVPHIDLLIGGSPCQGFSSAGFKNYFEDNRSKLIFDFIRLMTEVRPTYFLLENVVMKAEQREHITQMLKPFQPVLLKLNASRWSAQSRNRLYWTNIPYHDRPDDNEATMQNLIPDGYDGIYVVPRAKKTGGLQLQKEKCYCITANASWHYNHFVHQNGTRRQFTAHEAEQLFGLPIDYTLGGGSLGKCRRFNLLGNGWSVPVICVLFAGLL
jgi:site-specific DNA-cytosine methylase